MEGGSAVTNRRRADYHVYERVRATLVEQAKLGRVESYSWRDFNVGAAVLAWHPNEPDFKIFCGGNRTAMSGDPNKICAEKAAIAKAFKEGYTNIAAIAVIGPQQADQVTGIEGPTLRPCSACRNMLSSLPGVTDNTVIYTINLDDEMITEEFTVAELIELHLAHR